MSGYKVLPVDRLLAAYNLVLAAVWFVLLPRHPWAWLLCAAHLCGACLPRLFRRARATPSLPLAALRDLYPLLWLSAFWAELDVLRSVRPEQVYDGQVLALERVIFGTQLSDVLMPAMPRMWFSELLHLSYTLYYVLIFLPPLALAAAGRTAALRDVVFGLLVTYLGCYLIYMAAPVDGPHYVLPHYEGPLTDGFFYKLVWSLQGFGESRGATFPSSHVAGAVTIALLGWRWFRRPLAILLTAEAAGVVVGTVYTQNHYGVDALAGIIFALALQLTLAPVLRRALEIGARAMQPVPVLPRLPDLVGGPR